MTPNDHNAHDPADCDLGILCPDNYDAGASNLCFSVVNECAGALLATGAPAPLVVWHLLAAACVEATRAGLDSGTVIHGLHVTLDMVATVNEHTERKDPPHD